MRREIVYTAETMETRHEILTVLIGSRAHGLARPDSDYDYRGVYATPLRVSCEEVIKGQTRNESWSKDMGGDFTSYEVGHFLKYAVKGNPSMLEIFRGPVESATDVGKSLLELFPYVWGTREVYTAFRGYSKNQVRKLVDDPTSHRAPKYGIAAIRSLLMLHQLLSEGDFTLIVPGVWKEFFRGIKAGESLGEVMATVEQLRVQLDELYETVTPKKPDYARLSDWLYEVRVGLE